GVQLDGHTDSGGLLDDRVDVDRVRLSREQQSTSRMGENGQERIIERAQHALCHCRTIHAEARMDRADHVIELREQLGVIVETTVSENVGFDSLEDAKV